jgi:energy-coupling factor transport system ATP-binding protein
MFESVRVENLSFKYDRKEVLLDINLEINKSDLVLINGVSGSGKTTLLKLIGNQINKTKAYETIFLNNCSYASYNRTDIQNIIAVVNQEPDLQLCRITVYDEMTFALENMGLANEEIKSRADKFLDLAGLAEKGDLNCKFLSGGEKQKLIIASILAMGKSFILLDEPLAHLDLSSRIEMVRFIHEMKKRGITFLVIEHRISDLLEIADDTYSLINGKLGELNKDSEAIQKPKLKKSNASILELREVSYTVNNNGLLKNIQLNVKTGEIIGVFGANGSGKSTLLQCIRSLLPHKGKVICDKKVAILFQNPDFALIERTVLKTVDDHNLLVAAGLELEKINHPLCLSKGQRLRLAFLNILQEKPDILLLDEISSGQDPHHIKAIIDLLNYSELKAVIIVSHDLNILKSISDRIFELKDSALTEFNFSETFSNN